MLANDVVILPNNSVILSCCDVVLLNDDVIHVLPNDVVILPIDSVIIPNSVVMLLKRDFYNKIYILIYTKLTHITQLGMFCIRGSLVIQRLQIICNSNECKQNKRCPKA